ncbi:MAG: N-acetyltransferase family protein [Lentimicrobium sp.]
MAYSSKVNLPEGFVIRDFTSDDFRAVEKFWNENGLGGLHRGDSLKIIEDSLNAGGHLILMLDAKGIIAGTSWMTNDRRRTYLHHFGIAKTWRGNGLAKILLEKSLQLAVKDGFQIKIEVHRENLVALNLYKEAGFSYLGDYDVYMIRDLSDI